MDGDAAYVCNSYRNLNTAWRDRLKLLDFTKEQQYAQMTLVAFSILSLVMVLVFYLLLPELRAPLPGKIVFCLVTTLLAGHVFMTIDFPSRVACRVLGALSHATWLSAFAWMSALAVHMASTFYSPAATLKTSPLQIRPQFARYGAACWGVPAVVVLSCFVVDSLPESVSVQLPAALSVLQAEYGARVCAALSNPDSVLYLIYVPAAASVVLNLLAFIAAVLGIERTTRASSLAASSTSSAPHRKGRRRLLLYVKMSTGLGFTWIVGFIYAFLDYDWLLWTHVVLLSLQGTFTALAFLCNERVLSLLKVKVRQMRKAGKNNNKATTTKTRPTTTLTPTTTKMETVQVLVQHLTTTRKITLAPPVTAALPKTFKTRLVALITPRKSLAQ